MMNGGIVPSSLIFIIYRVYCIAGFINSLAIHVPRAIHLASHNKGVCKGYKIEFSGSEPLQIVTT